MESIELRFCFTYCLFLFPLTALPAAPPDPALLAQKIDARLAAGWKGEEVESNPVAGDADYVRRLYLDLLGRIPTQAEVRAFQASTTPKKREKLVDQLLANRRHDRHLATFWRRVWVPQADTPEFEWLSDEFEDWVAVRLASRTPYDQIVKEMLTMPSLRGKVKGSPRDSDAPARAFYVASDFKAENLAANMSRAFLGINIDCAQCHDHPFAKWTRNQFWETAAFFNPVSASITSPAKFEIAVPGSTKMLAAKTISEPSVRWPDELRADTGNKVLAAWLTDSKNPYFARNGVNRLWTNFFGTGLVEPLDDLGGMNAPSHPELLDELAQAFIDSNYDLTYLTKALVLTKAYQLTSTVTSEEDRSRLFSRMAVRGMTGEQLYDSLRIAAGLSVERDDLDPDKNQRERRLFAAQFRTDRPVSSQRSIIQALNLMNGPITAKVTTEQIPLLAAVAQSPFFDTQGQVEAIFLAVLARKPSAKELATCVRHVEKGGSHPDRDPAKALADVFWAVINSSEFSTNH
jgi:hypothetical protein